MLRMSLRGLLARKLRTALTAFAVVIGVAFVSGTFIFTDTINASFTDLFERVSRGVDVDITAKQAVEGDFGGRIQPLPDGTLAKVQAVDGVAAAQGNLETEVSIFDEQRERVGGNGPPTILFSHGDERFDPYTYVDGGPADAPGEMTMDQATADKGDWNVGDKMLVAGRAEAKPYTLVGIGKIGDQDSLGIGTLTMPLSEVQQIAQHAGRDHGDRRRGGQRHDPGAAQAADRPGARRHGRRAHGQGAGGGAGRRHQRVARLPHHRAADLRRHRGVRRRLPDLQHVRGDRGAALARVRAAADARRLAAAGAQLGDRRDADHRLRRLRARHPRRADPGARACGPCWRRSASSCPRPAR